MINIDIILIVFFIVTVLATAAILYYKPWCCKLLNISITYTNIEIGEIDNNNHLPFMVKRKALQTSDVDNIIFECSIH